MKASKRISEHDRFKSAIIVSAIWSNRAGSGGTELAMTGYPGAVQLWHWMDEYGTVERIEGGEQGSWRDAVAFLANNDEQSSCIEWNSIEIRGAPRFVGRLLAMAWSDTEALRSVARLLCRFSDDVLGAVDASGRGVWSNDLHATVLGAWARLQDAGLDIDDLPEEMKVLPNGQTGIAAVVDAAIDKALLRQQAEEVRIEELRRALEPWAPAIAEMERRWRLDHPPRRAGGSQYPAVGWLQLRAHVENHILAHGELPSGIKHILATPDAMAGRVADLVVNFDELLGDIARPHAPGRP